MVIAGGGGGSNEIDLGLDRCNSWSRDVGGRWLRGCARGVSGDCLKWTTTSESLVFSGQDPAIVILKSSADLVGEEKGNF